MKLYKFSILILLFTTPFLFIDKTVIGIPFWAITSIFFTTIYAILTILTIEFKWKEFS